MAWRILQFGALFAIGYTLESNSDSAFGSAAFETPNIELSLKLTDPQDVIVKKEQSALFRCQTESLKDQVQITWFHYEEKVIENLNWILRENGDLYIPKVTTDVLGEYRCLAQNRAGALLSNVAELKIASLNKFSINPSNTTVYVSQPTILRCGISSTPPAYIEWEFNNNTILPHQTSYVPLPNGILLIKNTQSSDAGAFRCKATNYLLKEIKYSKVAYIKVLSELPEATVPSFLPLDISPNVTVLSGEKLVLYCAVMGWPIPTVQWLNKDKVIGKNSILEVPDVQTSDAGNYICTASNNLGQISQTFRVAVRQAPIFTVKPNSKSYPAAITARLECRATGIPEPKITWLKDGQPLKFDSRVKKHMNGVIFSHTITNDSGMYQCVAVNEVGRVWTAVQIDIINISQTPQPPQNLKCRPYNSSTICLSWKSPNGISVKGYSVHSYFNDHGTEWAGPDYAINVTNMDASGLENNTEFSFYVRLYSTSASDPSEKVTCKTGVTGKRNLHIEKYSDNTSIVLKWSEISTDVSCTGEKFPYKVQWMNDKKIQTFESRKRSFVVTGLVPGVKYNFRVLSSNKDEKEPIPWISYFIPDALNNSTSTDLENVTSESSPHPPSHINAVSVSPFAVKLNWANTDKNANFFTVCYSIEGDQTSCEEGKLVNSTSNKIRIKKLKPNTMYEFRVRAHNSDGIPGIFSKPVYAITFADVPSAVTDLKYKVINATTVHLHWHKPKETGTNKIQKYIISYTPDLNRPLEKWPNLTVYSKDYGMSEESTVLSNLNLTTHYKILVMAVSEMGVGKPATLDITTKVKDAEADISTSGIKYNHKPATLDIATKNKEAEILNSDIKYNQKVGFIIGTIIALLCIICCISFILLRRKCVKRRALARSRMAGSNNYYPAVAHYASQVGSVQVRLEETCEADEQEIQFLVDDTNNTNISSLPTDCLDTKGGEEFPNGHSNGTAKPYMNGHVHITENPQYFAFSCNGQITKQPDTFTPLGLEEDSNSNVKPTKFYDLHKLFENSKKLKSSNHHRCNPHFGQNDDIRSSCDEVHSSESSRDVSLNGTQTTCLDETLNLTDQNRRKSPILGPNG